jgi:hypothetical protein
MRSFIFLICSLTASMASGLFIRPDLIESVSSEFNANYVAENTLNGSGLPVGFLPSDSHADYAVQNHWTTVSSDPTLAFIEWGFSVPTDLGTIYLWNHRSNVIAQNSGYDVVQFDLTLYDAANDVIATFLNLPLQPNIATGQAISLGTVYSNVSSVLFEVGAVENPASGFTGLAEVAFDTTVIPEPAHLGLTVGLGALSVLYRRRS